MHKRTWTWIWCSKMCQPFMFWNWTLPKPWINPMISVTTWMTWMALFTFGGGPEDRDSPLTSDQTRHTPAVPADHWPVIHVTVRHARVCRVMSEFTETCRKTYQNKIYKKVTPKLLCKICVMLPCSNYRNWAMCKPLVNHSSPSHILVHWVIS